MARVFIDKTFATAFHVPPPVRSDWRSYLFDQMGRAFPEHQKGREEEFHKVYRIYQLRGLTENRSPTPREIKVFVNNIGAIHRQRGDEIALPVQALYVVLSRGTRDLEQKLRTAAPEDLLGAVPVPFVGVEWRAALAAVYFNAPVEKALQLLVGERAEAALLSGNPDKLKELEKIYGITQVVEEIVYNNSQEWSKSDPSSLGMVARALQNSGLEEDWSLRQAWQRLRDATMQVTSWPRLSSEIGDGIISIFKRHKQENLANAIVMSLAKSSSGDGKSDSSEDASTLEPWTITTAKVLAAVQAEFPNVLQNFSVPGSAANYVAVMSLLGGRADADSVIGYFTPPTALKLVIAELVKDCSEGNFDQGNATAINAMLRVKKEWPWAPLVEQLKTRLNAENNLNVSEIKASLISLLRLRSVHSDSKALEFLAEQGHLEHQLYQCNQAKDQKAVALCIFPIMETIPDGTPKQTLGNTSNGQTIYTQFIADPAQQPELITELGDVILSFGEVEALFDLAKKSPTKNVAHAILKEIASDPESHENIPPTVISKHFAGLKIALDQPVLEQLLKKSIDEASLVNELVNEGFKAESADLYHILLQFEKDNSGFIDFLEKGLRGIDKDSWESELASEVELVLLVIELVRRGSDLNLGIPFQDALLLHARGLLDSKIEVKDAAAWSELLRALSPSSRETFLKRLGELLSSDESTDAILDLYGEELLTEPLLREIGDRLVFNAFPNFLNRKSLKEYKWIAGAVERDVLESVSSNTRKDFIGRVSEAYKENYDSEQIRLEVERIAELAKIKLPKIKEEKREQGEEEK